MLNDDNQPNDARNRPTDEPQRSAGRDRRRRRRGRGPGAGQEHQPTAGQGQTGRGPDDQTRGARPSGRNERGRPQNQGGDRREARPAPPAEGTGRPGRRPPRPHQPRRPRREEDALERITPQRHPHVPATPNPAREGPPGHRAPGERPAPTPSPGRHPDRREPRPGRREQPGERPPARPAAERPPKPAQRADAKPRATAAGRLRVVPLGGVHEIGKNMTLVEYGRDIVLLDCGGKFPEEEQRGIDLIIPDVSYVRDHLSNLRGIVITHGHEDHIGGLPYIIPQLKGRSPIPIYGSPLALGFIEGKLVEHRLDKYVELHRVRSGERVQLGSLAAEFIHVTHSIPDTNAIAIHSPVGTIVDTADFKFDPTPVMGGPTDERRLRRLGDQGVLALFSDTVRVETPGSTPSERVVLETMDQVIRQARGQVIIATFASNISRIHMALKAAQKYGRKVAVAGRSMEQNARVALDLGYLDPAPGLLLPLDDVLKLPREKRVLVITGSQGEAAAALSRIAAGEHPRIRVGKGDVALLSATPIPGNEETVTRTIDNLFRRGAKVVYSALERGVHVSGHAGRDELRRMIELLRPKYVVPIHGEYRHMVLYRDLAGEAGIPPERVLLPEIGGVIEFTKEKATQRGRIPAGSILVDRLGDRSNGLVQLRDREHLADDGVVVVTIVVDRETGDLIAGPDLFAKGLKPELQDGALREAEAELKRTLERRQKGEVQYGQLVQRAKETVGKALYRRSKSRPMILPMVTEL